MKLTHHSDGPGSPLVQFMTPKMDDALSRLHSLSGLQLRQVLPREHYPWLVFGAGCMELLGGILFTLNLKLGALLLVRVARVCVEPWAPRRACHCRVMCAGGLAGATPRLANTTRCAAVVCCCCRRRGQMAFIVPTSFIMHNFWDLPQGSPAHQIEFVNFAKVGAWREGQGCAMQGLNRPDASCSRCMRVKGSQLGPSRRTSPNTPNLPL
jgi:hypothetical protein